MKRKVGFEIEITEKHLKKVEDLIINFRWTPLHISADVGVSLSYVKAVAKGLGYYSSNNRSSYKPRDKFFQ